jgi:hypothetical protein
MRGLHQKSQNNLISIRSCEVHPVLYMKLNSDLRHYSKNGMVWWYLIWQLLLLPHSDPCRATVAQRTLLYQSALSRGPLMLAQCIAFNIRLSRTICKLGAGHIFRPVRIHATIKFFPHELVRIIRHYIKRVADKGAMKKPRKIYAIHCCAPLEMF